MKINQKKLIQILTLCVILLFGYSVFITVEKNKLVNKGRLEIDGGTYIGDLVNGVRHGEGRFVDSSGTIYKGNWVNDLKHGKGRFVGTKKSEIYGYEKFIYNGYWKDDLEHGKGTYTWEDLGIKMNPLDYKSRGKYEGEWKEGKFHGQGIMKFESGSSYEGGFKDGKTHGKGTFKGSDGSSYEGGYKDGLVYGQGIYTRADKTVLIPIEGKGKFEKGKMVGSFTETKPDGTTRTVKDPKF